MPFSTFLDGQTPDQLRGLMWLSLADTGYILANTVTSDSGGGGTSVWGTAGTAECRVDPMSGNETSIAGRIDDRSTHRITLPPGTPVTTENRILVSGRGTFEVTAVRAPTREWVRVVEAVET